MVGHSDSPQVDEKQNIFITCSSKQEKAAKQGQMGGLPLGQSNISCSSRGQLAHGMWGGVGQVLWTPCGLANLSNFLGSGA